MNRSLQTAALALLLGLNSTAASAATYYLGSSGRNRNSCSAAQSPTTPKASFSSIWGCLSSGDTVIVADGTYSDASPPSGKSGAAGAPITVRAANDGGATISDVVNFRGNAFLTFVGFKVIGPNTAVDVRSNGSGRPSHHLTFQRLAFTCTSTNVNDDACFAIADGSHHLLLEDFWGWGGGRYTVMLYGGPGGNPLNVTADHNVLRRGVLRMGPSSSSSGNPQAGLALYYASNNLVENVIVLDSQTRSNSSNAAFYLTTHAPPPQLSNNKFYGVIALNNEGVGWYLDHDGTGIGNELHNSIIWGSGMAGIEFYGAGTCTGNFAERVTVGASNGNGVQNYKCRSTSVTSSVLVNNKGYGLLGGSVGSLGTVNWNVVFGNSGGVLSGVSPGANNKTADPALKYIGRIEAGSAATGAGEGGVDAGANVSMRYQDGVLTTQSLWPWPNEERIKKDMCTDAGSTRGFCRSSSLTDYIWSYLGNPNPFGGPTAPARNEAVIR
jgi:hypothetical protein